MTISFVPIGCIGHAAAPCARARPPLEREHSRSLRGRDRHTVEQALLDRVCPNKGPLRQGHFKE
jgi:hypothetical protein